MHRIQPLACVALLSSTLVAAQSASAGGEWIRLFDGKSLNGWKEAPFHGRGRVDVKDGMIRLGQGSTTGIAWTGDFPRSGYEVRFEAARLEGKDFFAALVFPFGEAYCSWINGGWDGTVVGLSNLDGNDASENDTSTIRDFVQGRWYGFRIAVTDRRIRAWIDDSPVIDVEISGRQVGLRFDDTDLCTPLGFASYATVGGLRNIEYRRIAGAGARAQ